MKWYIAVIKKYAVFSGRARRREYWMFIVFNILFMIVAVTLDYLLNIKFQNMSYGYISLIYTLAILLPTWAVVVRRLHDTGKSGWYLFVTLIPFIGSLWLLALLISDSQPGGNQYGPNPKGISAPGPRPAPQPVRQTSYASTASASQPVLRAEESRTLGGSEQEYVNNCLQPKYTELPESRKWNSDPAFKKILDPLNAGDNAAAIREAEALVASFTDFGSLYNWWGTACLRSGSLGKARQVLKEGVEKANKKCDNCNTLGEVEWKARDLNSAVYWWAQGMHGQEALSASNYGGSVDSYLYLNYVAEGLGQSGYSRAFLRRVDAIRAGMVRLNSSTANDLIGLARTSKNPAAIQVVKGLVEKYIDPPLKPSLPDVAEEQGKNAFASLALEAAPLQETANATLAGVFYRLNDSYFSVLRFFRDGKVVSVSVGKITDLKASWPTISTWFNHNYDNCGTYHLSGSDIEFSATSQTGTVDYRGKYLEEKLILSSYSHINQHRATDVEYTRMPGITE